MPCATLPAKNTAGCPEPHLFIKKGDLSQGWRERIIRGCACAVLRDCNIIELVHAKLTHTYAATRRLSGMHVGRASVMFSVFQFFRFV